MVSSKYAEAEGIHLPDLEKLWDKISEFIIIM